MRRQTGRTRLREKASGSAVIRTMYRAAATAAWTGSKENGRKDAEIAKLKEELVGAREEIVMLHKNLSPEEQAMMRAAMDRAFEEERK